MNWRRAVISTERMARTRAKRSGNRGVLTKLINEVDGLLNDDEMDTQRLQIIAELLNEKLKLLKSFDEEIIEGCNVDEIAYEIEEYEEINLRVLSTIRSVMEATSPKVSDKFEEISTVKTTIGDENAPSTSLQSSTGLQITKISVNVDSENEQLTHEPGS